MKAYVVRLNAQQTHPREIVGFYFAEDREQLCRLVDECCDVVGCEAVELPAGGIFWGDVANCTVPMKVSEDDPGFPAGATLTGWWMNKVFEDRGWEPLDPHMFEAANED